MEHDVEYEEEDGEAEVLMRQQTINPMCSLIGVLLVTGLVFGLLQGSVDETVLGVHDGCLGVAAGLFLYAGRCLIALGGKVAEVLYALLTCHVLAQVVEHLTIVLKELKREVAGRVVLGDMLVGLKVLLDVRDTVFNFVAVVDMQVARELAGALVNLNYGAEEFLYTHTVFERCWYHRCTKQGAEGVEINVVATALKLVVHVERAHHAHVHIYKLGGEIEVALKV